MSNIYKTPLFKSLKLDEKLGADGKLIGLEDLLPNLAKKIENSLGKDDLNFAKDYDFDGLEGMFNWLNANKKSVKDSNVQIITHGTYLSDEQEIVVEGQSQSQLFIYKTSLTWDEIKISSEFDRKESAFSKFISHYGGIGFETLSTNSVQAIHRISIFDVAAPAEQSGGSIIPAATITPIPDEIIALCKNGRFVLNTTYTDTGTQLNYTPACKSFLFGDDGQAIRFPMVYADVHEYDCLWTVNYSPYPVAIQAEITAFE